MYAYIFVVHHDCSYVDGMAIINACDYAQAETIFRRATWADAVRPGEGKSWNDDTLKERIIDDADKEERDSIRAEYPDKIEKRVYYNIWCLIDVIPISPNKATSTGLKAFAYHDG